MKTNLFKIVIITLVTTFSLFGFSIPEKGYLSKAETNVFEVKNEFESTDSLWTKYNFVPGDEIIFYDDLTGEINGEFPSRWDLLKGNAEIAKLEDENILHLKRQSIITPLFESEDYLPEQFTIEFDAYFNGDPGPYSWQNYDIRFALSSGGWYYPVEGSEDYYYPLTIYRHGADLSAKINGNDREFQTYEESLKEPDPLWRHIAIAFNKRSLKVFIDEHRVLNIPNLGFQPKQLSIGAESYSEDDYIRAIRNIRIAKGGADIYQQIVNDGKYITRGILFDVNKASLKPESMGVINQMANLLKEHEGLSLRIEGHTDSDGEEEYNLNLSQQRADALKNALVAQGIEAERLETVGKGEAKPVAENTTEEGKANNRRVEFIQMKK